MINNPLRNTFLQIAMERDEKTVLEMVGALIDESNKFDAKLDKANTKFDSVIKQLNKKVDKNGDFTGTWHGMKPSQTNEFIQSQVDKNEEYIKDISINAKEFGIVADGRDCNAGFISAMEYAEENGILNMFIPDGTYYMDNYFEIPPNTRITITCGKNVVFKRINNAGDIYSHYFAVCGKTKGTTGYGGGASHFSWTGGKFIGEENTKGRKLFSFTLNHADNFTFKDMHFVTVTYYAHVFDLLGCSNITIDNCIMEGRFLYEGRNYAEAIQLDNSYLEGGGGQFTNHDNLGCKNITIQNCSFIPVYYKDGHIQYYAPNPFGAHNWKGDNPHTNIKFINNYVKDCAPRETGSKGGWIRTYYTEDCLIENNTFENTHSIDSFVIAFQTKEYEEYGVVPCKRITIRNNVFRGFDVPTPSPRALIKLEGTTGAVHSSIIIDGNSFINCYSDLIVSASSTLGSNIIEAEYVNRMSVTNNIFYNVRRAIDASNCSNIMCTNNHVRYAHFMTFYFASSKNITVNSNTCDSISGFVRPTDGCSNITIVGNNVNNVLADAVGSFKYLVMIKGCKRTVVTGNTFYQQENIFTSAVYAYGDSIITRVSGNCFVGFSPTVTFAGSYPSNKVDDMSLYENGVSD